MKKSECKMKKVMFIIIYYFITILYASSSSFHVPVYMYMPSTELILKRGLSKFYWHDMFER